MDKRYFVSQTVLAYCEKCFANSQPSALNFKSFSRLLEQFCLTGGPNNFCNKIPFFRPVVKKEEGGTVSEHFKDEDYFFKPPSFINPRIKMKIDETNVIDENKAIDEKEATNENEFIEHDHEEHEYVFNSEYDYDPEYLVDDYETVETTKTEHPVGL